MSNQKPETNLKEPLITSPNASTDQEIQNGQEIEYLPESSNINEDSKFENAETNSENSQIKSQIDNKKKTKQQSGLNDKSKTKGSEQNNQNSSAICSSSSELSESELKDEITPLNTPTVRL